MILVECFSDKVLLKTLLPNLPNSEIKHSRKHGGRGNILNFLNNDQNTHQIGMIDEDEPIKLLDLIPRFEMQEETTGIKVYFRKDNENSLVVLCADLEEWILKACRISGIRISKFKIPENKAALHDLSTENNCRKIIPIIEALINRQSLWIQNLTNILNRLLNENY